MPQQSYIVNAGEKNEELVTFLAHRHKTSKKGARRLLDQRVVFVNNRRVWMARHRLRPGDHVEVHASAAIAVAGRQIEILYEDSHFLVVNKLPEILSNGPDSLETVLRKQIHRSTLEAVHRLDRDTSGCILFAKNRDAKESMIAPFESHHVTKTYHAIVFGEVPANLRHITTPIEGKTAATRLIILSANRTASHLKLLIETGRTHQIRKHMASVHHPVLGDKIYFTINHPLPELRRVPRQMLHASGLSFRQPITNALVRAKAPFPADYMACLKMLKLE